MSLGTWYREERSNVSDTFGDEFRGITVLQVVSTIALAMAVFLNALMNVWVYYDGLSSSGPAFLAAGALAAVALGLLATIVVRYNAYAPIAVMAVIAGLLYFAELEKANWGFYLAVTLVPGILGSYGIWRRAVIPLYSSFILLMASIFIYSNPIDTPLVLVFAFAVTSLVYLETGHIAITFTRVKNRVLENQRMSAVFMNLYRRVIRRYAISSSMVLALTAGLTYILVDMNSLMARAFSGLVVHSFEMTSFTGVAISATIGLLALSLIRTALPR